MRCIVLAILGVLSVVPAQAYDLGLCTECNDRCDRQAKADDDTCCKNARGSMTSDFCMSSDPNAYHACSKDLVSIQGTCKAACDRTVCQR